MPQPPALTPEQRQAALAKAAKVRRERAEVKEKLKLGSITLSELLTTAIGSMIEVTDERDIDSLFSEGPTTALTQTIAGLDDFELIAFIAVIDPAQETE